MPSYKVVLVISLCLVSILSANPIQRVRELDFVPKKGFQSQGSKSQSKGFKINEELCNSSDRSCELHHRTQDFYIWRARPHELIFPIYHAVPELREFCYAVLAQVNEHWSLQTPLPSFWIKQGILELIFHSVGGPIPWSVVADLAHKMLCTIQMGWEGPYDITYRNTAADLAVGVTLQIGNHQLPLPQHRLTQPMTFKAAKRTQLKKRSKVQPAFYKIHSAILPLSLSAPHLKAFFDAIAAEASSAWTSRPEAALLTVSQGSFQLTVSCLGARIPWPMLVFASRQFSTLATRSWASTFDAFFEAPGSGITVAFSLRLLESPADPSALALSLPTKRTPSSLLPRSPVNPFSTQLHVARFIQTVALVPTALAAVQFEDFYNILALMIETGQMANRPPARRIVYTNWDFELTFSSATMTVPWSFVQAFAIDMAAWSSRQFSGFYEAEVRGEGALSGLVIMVKMGLKGVDAL